MQRFGFIVLRFGIAAVFLWFGIQQVMHPSQWVRMLPDWGYIKISSCFFYSWKNYTYKWYFGDYRSCLAYIKYFYSHRCSFVGFTPCWYCLVFWFKSYWCAWWWSRYSHFFSLSFGSKSKLIHMKEITNNEIAVLGGGYFWCNEMGRNLLIC